MATESEDGVTDEQLKRTVKALTPAGTQEVADRVGMTRQGVDYRLRKLEESDTPPVWSKKIGPTKIWLHAEKVHPR